MNSKPKKQFTIPIFIRDCINNVVQMAKSIFKSGIPGSNAEPLEHTQFPVDLTNKSVDISVHSQLQLNEIRNKANDFHYLLDATSLYFGEERTYERETPETLIKKWKYILEATYCENLLKNFKAIQQAGYSSEKTLNNWFNFLLNMGLERFYSPEEKVELSPDNRGNFVNGRLFDDGTVLFIDEYPWFLNGELLIRGKFYME